jgi:hypothetical protein
LRVLRSLVRTKRGKVAGEWRRLRNEELRDLCCSQNIIRVIKSSIRDGRGKEHVWGRGAYRILVGRPEGKKPLGRYRCRLEDNIKMNLQEVGWRAWSGLIWLRIGTGGGLL